MCDAAIAKGSKDDELKREHDKETLRKQSEFMNKWLQKMLSSGPSNPVTLDCPVITCPFFNKCYNDPKKCNGSRRLFKKD